MNLEGDDRNCLETKRDMSEGDGGRGAVGILSGCGHVQTVCGLGRQSQGHSVGNVGREVEGRLSLQNNRAVVNAGHTLVLVT